MDNDFMLTYQISILKYIQKNRLALAVLDDKNDCLGAFGVNIANTHFAFKQSI